jgi:hypothetical protein
LHKVTRENLWEKTVRIKDLSLLWNLLLREIFVSIFRQQAVRWLKKSEKKIKTEISATQIITSNKISRGKKENQNRNN